MQASIAGSGAEAADRGFPELVLGPYLALTAAPTRGVRLFARRPPVHSIILGRARMVARGSVHRTHALAIPANLPHALTLESSFAAVAYLDARYFRFDDARRLAHLWRHFVPGKDDLREAFGDAQKLPRRRVDARLLRALETLELEDLTVREAAARVGLSESRLTHAISETLGAPPRTWRTWFKLRRAIAASLEPGANLTRAAHRAGFTDSAHLTRTCKQLTGVLPSQMMPRNVLVP